MVSPTRVDAAHFHRDGFRFFTASPTRWGDCDAFGHVNNVLYSRYYESGRLDYFRRVLDLEPVAGATDSLIIADLYVTFLRQLHHPCALEVGSRICRLGKRSFDFEAALFAPGEGEPRSTAQATCVWFNFRDNHSLPIPDAQRAVIQQFEGIES